ncbi:MAG: TonB-dependent receptor [Pseudomonadota bacterium]
MAALRVSVAVLACAVLVPFAYGEEQQRRVIEDIVVTAEKRESTVSDTSISITAFGEDMIEDFGMQGPDELVNFIPATTRDAYDIRIRGVGRNFRALGGDPGVATYYNGIYSEDFGIASTENGLYDVARIEVLRGPQGTLYGRNSIGGALNYITNRPTYEFEGEFRTVFGSYSAREQYGLLSGPIIQDKLAYRITGVMIDRDEWQDGINESEDINGFNDENFSAALQWNISDNQEAYVRWNKRSSDRTIGQNSIVDSGTAAARGIRDTTTYAFGAARPGVDISASSNPNPGFGLAFLPLDSDIEDLDGSVATNDFNNETFDQEGINFSWTWDINDTTTLKYLFGWQDFEYTFDIDLDATNGEFVQPRQTVLEDVETASHELQLLWQIGDNLEMTSGIYFFKSKRLQNFAFRDFQTYTSAFDYGTTLPLFTAFANTQATHARRGDAALGATALGPWEGDPTGHYYEYWNKVNTDATAVYTQGTYTFNEEWALTVGVRWAEDEKDAFEDRTGYFEALFLNGALDPTCDGAFGIDCTLLGITPLAFTNILSGAAVPTFNPAAPIAPTCPLGTAAGDCPGNRLLLQGVPFSFADRAAGSDDWGDTSFRVNLDWTPNEDTLVYLSVTTGYRSGGYSLGIGDSRGPQPGGSTGVVPLTYDQEEVTAYEIGYKGTLLDGQLQLNTSAYLYTYDGYQDRIEIQNATNPSVALDQVINADEAENMGVEFEIMWLATDNLTIGGNGSYTKTEYKSDLLVLEDDNPFAPTTFVNLNGNDLKRIPEWKATVWANYEWQLENGTVTAGLVYAYTGEYFSSGIERDLDLVPDRERVDASITWRDSRDQWVVRAFVDNVLDKVYARGFGTATATANFNKTAELLYPRYYGVDVTFRWGAF